MMVGTFKALAQYGEFDGSQINIDESGSLNIPPQDPGVVQMSPAISMPASNGMAVNLNIELSLPADETGKVYDAFFKSMKKHLIDAKPHTD
tara:strand:- start:148751 stop:149023 length:273 start_codon:yes stop_codon:yes gene_type:complete